MLDENNKIKELKNLAIIFNGVKSRGLKGYGYGYGYGMGYEDGNGNGVVRKKKSIFGKIKV